MTALWIDTVWLAAALEVYNTEQILPPKDFWKSIITIVENHAQVLQVELTLLLYYFPYAVFWLAWIMQQGEYDCPTETQLQYSSVFTHCGWLTRFQEEG